MAPESKAIDFRSVVDQHYAMLYRFAYRLSGSAAEAEDLTQETFCVAQGKLWQLRDPASTRAWLCRILRNAYLQGRRSPSSAMLYLEDLSAEPEQAPTAVDELDSQKLQGLLQELPETYRTPLILFYFEEFSYQQIAEQMGIPIGTVMSRLSRAKGYLRARLQGTPRPLPASISPGVSR